VIWVFEKRRILKVNINDLERYLYFEIIVKRRKLGFYALLWVSVKIRHAIAKKNINF
jgi:hypothetical protein